MKSPLVVLSAALAFGLAACSSVPSGTAARTQDAVTRAPEMTSRERVQLVVQLLDQGQEARALEEIEVVLAENPASPVALKLRHQVQGDPQKILGASYRTYTVVPGDTLSSLAETHLGDAMLFYALSRYNELPSPNRLMVGQSLKLPDSFAGAPKSLPAPPVALKVAVSPPKASAKDVDSARTLRLEALEHLNKGNADQAVTLLEKASQLDSGNPSISEDLARAQRIQKTLRATD